MALTLINLSGFVRGIPAAESGINCEKISLSVEPEINETLPGIDGQVIGKAVGDPMGKLTISGEVSGTMGTTGILAATFIAAFVPSNASILSAFGRSQGGWYADKFQLDWDRNAFLKLAADFTSHFHLA